MNDSQKRDTLAHEVGHANQTARDPVQSEKDRQLNRVYKQKFEATGFEQYSHNSLPAEIYANRFKDRVAVELK